MKITQIVVGIVVLLVICAIGYIAYKIHNPGTALGGLGVLGAIVQGWRGILGGGAKKLTEQIAKIEGKYDPKIAQLEAELKQKEQEIDRLTQLKLALLQRNRDLEMDRIAQALAERRAEVRDRHALETERLLEAHRKYEQTGDISGYRKFLETRRSGHTGTNFPDEK